MQGQKVKEHKIVKCKGCKRKADADPYEVIRETFYDLYYGDSCGRCGWSPDKE